MSNLCEFTWRHGLGGFLTTITNLDEAWEDLPLLSLSVEVTGDVVWLTFRSWNRICIELRASDFTDSGKAYLRSLLRKLEYARSPAWTYERPQVVVIEDDTYNL